MFEEGSNKDSNNSDTQTVTKPEKVRWGIGWYVLFILGPAAFIGPFVALFLGFYSAAPESSFFLWLAILGIILYGIIVFCLLRALGKASDINYKPGPVSVSDADDYRPNPKIKAGLIGMALFHGLFGGRSQSN